MRKYHYTTELPLAVHNLGHVKFDLKQFQAAESCFLEGYKLSIAVGDMYALADSLVGLAELYYWLDQLSKIASYALEMDDLENKGYEFPLFFGRMKRLQGEVAMNTGDYVAAGHFFAEGIVLIGRHGGYSRYSLTDELLRLTRNMARLPSAQVLAWCDLFESVAQNAEPESARREILEFIKVRRAIT